MTGQVWNAVSAFLFGMIVAISGVGAEELDRPAGAVVLTVTGDDIRENAQGAAQFDLAMLKALDSTEFETTTIWTDGVQKFRGVSISRLLKALGVASGRLEARAVNDYMVEIPVADAIEGGPIIAYELNGKPMSLRDKGPLWIVYPYDSKSDYLSEMIYARSIWQLDRIEVVR